MGMTDSESELTPETLRASRRPHDICDDCWYSCPKSGDCCNDFVDKDECRCGADEDNASLDAHANAWEQQLQQKDKEIAELKKQLHRRRPKA